MVYIHNLRIDRFGSISDLEIDGLSDGITVVHGSTGTGKTALLHFVRAMLYGFDDAIRAQYLHLSEDAATCGGSISVTQRRGSQHQVRQTIRRHDDGSFDGRLTVEHEDGRTIGRSHVQELLSGVSPVLFDRLFAIDFARRPEIGGLLDEAAHCGFEWCGDGGDSRRLRDLRERLDSHHRALDGIPLSEESVDALRSRRAELIDEIAAAETHAAGLHDHDRAKISAQIDARQEQLDGLRVELRSINVAIDQAAAERLDWRQRLEAAAAAGAGQRGQQFEPCDLDAQIDRWRGVLEEVVIRKTWLDDHPLAVRQSSPAADAATNMACLCEARQLARCQLELDQAIGYLTAHRDALASAGQHGDTAEDADWLEQQLVGCDSKTDSLLRRRDAVIAEIDQAEVVLTGLRGRFKSLANDAGEQSQRKRAQLERIEQQMRCAERRHATLSTIADLSHQIRQLEPSVNDASVVQQASEYLRGLSGGDLRRIEASQDKHVWVTDQAGHRLSWGHLTEGARDQVYLSLCMALADALQRRGVEIPLVLKGVFTNFESRQVAAAAQTLRHFVARGHQLLLLTRHEHVASVFRLANVAVRELQARPTASQTRPIEPTALDPPSDDLTPPRHLVTIVDRYWDSEEFPGELTDRVRLGAGDLETHDRETGESSRASYQSPRSLSEHSPIQDAPSLDHDNALRLRKINVTTIGELIDVSAADVAAELRYAGVTTKMVESWQAQALLMCRVPRLRAYDARILVACGITSPEQLNQVPPEQIRTMIEKFAASSAGRAMLLSGTEYELSRVTDWIKGHNGGSLDGNARYLSAGTSTRVDSHQHDNSADHGGRGRRNRQSHPRGARTSRSSGGRAIHRRTSRTGRSSSASAGSKSSDSDATSGRSNSAHSNSSRANSGHSTTGHSNSSHANSGHSSASHAHSDERAVLPIDGHQWRFFLKASDPVVEAPSIGPRTAERLEQAGVVSVSELLSADAATLAERIDYRRINAGTIRQWQQQTGLVCSVPQLRGHDAQILVALDVTDAEQLAGCDPQELWSRVEPFVASNQGKRIVRSGKEPDFEEVFNWIKWARSAKSQKAA